MKKSILTVISLLLAACLCLCACGKTAPAPAPVPEATEAPAEESAAPGIPGSGTEEDPWLVGADDPAAVTVTLYDDMTVWVSGTGAMRDFASAEERPWNDVAAHLTGVMVFDGVSHIGSLAFMGAGSASDGFDAGFYSELESIGERAFDGAAFASYCILTLPESVTELGARAFADCALEELYIDGTPVIAEDAFAGLHTRVFVRYDGSWDESNMLPYGGEVEYVYTYALHFTEDYGTDEITGEGTAYIPEGELFEYNAEDYISDENYVFSHYEVVSGELELADPTDPVISAQLTGNVDMVFVYKHK